MKNTAFFLLLLFNPNFILKAQSFCDAEFSCNVPSITFSAASISGWGDSAVHINITNNSSINYAYPQAKLFNTTPLPPGMTLNSNFNYWMPFASSWNIAQTSPYDCGYDVAMAIPANYMVTFTLWLRPNDLAVGYDTCRFQSNFTVNLNPQTGIAEQFVFSEIAISPNPANNQISFSALQLNSEITTVRVINLIGQELLFSKMNSSKTLDVSMLSNGIYLAVLQNSNDEIVGMARFVKE